MSAALMFSTRHSGKSIVGTTKQLVTLFTCSGGHIGATEPFNM
jgi:hypothetical protein